MKQERRFLTPQNVLQLMKEDLQGRKPNRETMLCLSFYMDFAISTESIALIEQVQNQIDSYYLHNFS